MERLNWNEGWLCNGRPVALPHDAMLEEKRDPACPSGSAGAYFPGGKYLYRKAFLAPKEWEGKKAILLFEGAYRKAEVALNGEKRGGAPYGYIPFFVELKNLHYGEENEIVVSVDNSEQPNSRWYAGSGIYRSVWLYLCQEGGLLPEEAKVSTLSVDPIRLKVEAPEGYRVQILADEGKIYEGPSGEIALKSAKLWDDIHPHLYRCIVNKGNDSTEIKFGIRKIEVSPQGFFINGRNVKLAGVCLHEDNGILGAKSYKESEYRRARILKDAGFNAIRSAHNPANPYLLEACDEIGLYVIDETWDMWYSRKNKYDYACDFKEHYAEDIRSLVSRDFNHPSVIAYSIGNEVSEPATKQGVELSKKMVDIFHGLDGTRPVSGGFNLMIIKNAAKGKGIYDEEQGGMRQNTDSFSKMNSTLFNMITQMVGTGMNKSANGKEADAKTSPLFKNLDLCGYNYASGRYPMEGKKHPERAIFGSETFPQDIAKNWAMVQKYPYLVGDFMWTGIDYLGEAGIGAWAYSKDGKGFNKPYPWKLADTGVFDLIGEPTGEAFWASAVFGVLSSPKIAIQPLNHHQKPTKMVWRGTNAIESYSWRGCEGKKGIVEVYFPCHHICLYQNGKKVGKKKAKNCRALFKIKYVSGTLEAVAYDQEGQEIGRSELKSAQKARLTLFPEEKAEAGKLLFVKVRIGDGEAVESNFDDKVTLQVEGGTLLAFGSANPRSESNFLSGSYETYYGRALAIVEVGDGKTIKIKAGSNKLGNSEIELPILQGGKV